MTTVDVFRRTAAETLGIAQKSPSGGAVGNNPTAAQRHQEAGIHTVWKRLSNRKTPNYSRAIRLGQVGPLDDLNHLAESPMPTLVGSQDCRQLARDLIRAEAPPRLGQTDPGGYSSDRRGRVSFASNLFSPRNCRFTEPAPSNGTQKRKSQKARHPTHEAIHQELR